MKGLPGFKRVPWRRISQGLVLVVGVTCLASCQSHGEPATPWQGSDRLAESLNITTSQLQYWKPGNR